MRVISERESCCENLEKIVCQSEDGRLLRSRDLRGESGRFPDEVYLFELELNIPIKPIVNTSSN